MARLNTLLLGSGGRESALAWKLSQSPVMGDFYIAPGNGGTGSYGHNVLLSPMDFEAIERFVEMRHIDLIVVGNEDPLVAGIYDYFKGKNVLVAGPSKAGAELEGSKDFAKRFMMKYSIPTARYQSFTADTIDEGYIFLETLRPPYVLKADGLAAGKGVLIIDDISQACASLESMLGGMFGKSSSTVVIEEFLKGMECSVFVLTDGTGNYRVLPVAKDYKRVGEGDTGLNTGGMGAVSPVPFADEAFMQKVEERIIRPTIAGLIAENITYCGFIFFGLINVDSDPMVIEYNVRMGDPETEVVMPRIVSDLLPLLEAAAKGNLGDMPLEIKSEAAVTVMAVSAGYPGKYAKGKEITGCNAVEDSILFHAGTSLTESGELVTAGGRVISVTSLGKSIPEALEKSYCSMDKINFEGKNFRRDIGKDVLNIKC